MEKNVELNKSKITEINKDKNNNFYDFFINLNKFLPGNFINDFLGLNNLPLIGHYNKNDYSFGKIHINISFNFKILQGKNFDELNNSYIDFNPPENIIEYININEELLIKNNTKTKTNTKFHPKENVNFNIVFTSLPQTNKEISLFNIVPHLYYLQNNLDFSNTKRLVFENSICLFYCDPFKCNINSQNGKNDIYLNDLRFEYNSVHLKKGSLAFSPNNLRFNILEKEKEKLTQFYIIINEPNKEYLSVFLYIIMNNEENEKIIEKIGKNSNNIKELIIEMEKEYSSENEIIKNLKYLFKI